MKRLIEFGASIDDVLMTYLGPVAISEYSSIIDMMGLEELEKRRLTLCKTFATKMFQHPEHRKMFKLNRSSSTRSRRKIVVPQNKRQRYEKSSIPSLAKLINLG